MCPARFPLILLLMVLLGSCATPKKISEVHVGKVDEAQEGSAGTTQTWQVGSYQVRFAAGPHKFEPSGHKSFSTFSVTYQKEGQVWATEVATSAINIESLLYGSTTKITDFVKVFVSPSERYLLISEDVPNDCAPCSNFLLFELVGEELKVSYLRMPTSLPPVKPGEMPPIFLEYPTIRRLTNEAVDFEFADKKRKTLRFQEIPRAEGVRFPG